MYVGGPAYRCLCHTNCAHHFAELRWCASIRKASQLSCRTPRTPTPAGMHIKTRGDYWRVLCNELSVQICHQNPNVKTPSAISRWHHRLSSLRSVAKVLMGARRRRGFNPELPRRQQGQTREILSCYFFPHCATPAKCGLRPLAGPSRSLRTHPGYKLRWHWILKNKKSDFRLSDPKWRG